MSDHVDSDSDVRPFADARPDDNESENSKSGEEDLDTFIVDDVAGSSGHISLPAAFSMDTHQDLAHHFKIICQYFVHLALATVRNKASTSKQLLDGMSLVTMVLHSIGLNANAQMIIFLSP